MRFRHPAFGLLALLVASTANAQSFTYQGSLKDGGSPANGLFNLDFALFDAASAGTQIGSTIMQNNVNVAQGLFTTELDFGAAAFSVERLPPPDRGASEDDWWQANIGRVVAAWALVEAPTILGVVAYTLTHDFRTLLAPFIGLLLFANYRPKRLTER